MNKDYLGLLSATRPTVLDFATIQSAYVEIYDMKYTYLEVCLATQIRNREIFARTELLLSKPTGCYDSI